MNEHSESRTSLVAYVVAVVGAFLIMAAMAWLLRHHTRPEPVDTARSKARRDALVELRSTTSEQLENYGYVDPAKDQVRLPIDRGMQMVVQQWRDPAAARSNLLARVERFNPPPPPPAPEQPSKFE